MHSMPPLVMISSSRSGRLPCRRSWRSTRNSRTLGMPSLGAYWSAIPGSSRSSRATISSRSAVGNVAGFGKPPDIERAPGGGPARIVASSAAPRFCARWANSNIEPQRALLAAVERGDVRLPVGQLVQRALARARVAEDRALGAADRLAGLERSLDLRGGGDDEPVVVAEHDVARRAVEPAEAHRRVDRRPRDRRSGARQRAPRVGG